MTTPKGEPTERDREMAREIVGPHFYVDGDSWFSCGLAREREQDEPGSGCSNDENRGRCTCGLDERIERAASLLATARAEGEKRGLERAAEEAERCWHGPGDHGCTHGSQIASAIRALSAKEE